MIYGMMWKRNGPSLIGDQWWQGVYADDFFSKNPHFVAYLLERKTETMNKIYNAIMGLVVGDALGVPFEFQRRDTYKATDMVGFGTHQQLPGTWSDDSSLTLATMESIIRRKTIDLDDIMNNFTRWFFDKEFTACGEVFDVGNTTASAIIAYRTGQTHRLHDLCGIRNNGNGALMRILPVILFGDRHGWGTDVLNVAELTHGHQISQCACWVYKEVVDRLLDGASREEAITAGVKPFLRNIRDNPTLKDFRGLSQIAEFQRSEIRSTGYVVDTLKAAFWCFVNSNTYEDCVLTAVNLGDDTDTVAAVAGGLAGIYYGCGGQTGIPDRWIQQIARREWIGQLCRDFEKLISK